MKIRKLTIKNYKMFDDLELDFTDSNGNPLDLIVLAGVNGSGKTSLLSLLGRLFSQSSNRFISTLPLNDLSAIPCQELAMEVEFTSDQVSVLANLISEFFIRQDMFNESIISQLKAVKQKLSRRNLSFLSFLYKIAEVPQGMRIETNDFLPFGIPNVDNLSKHFGVLYFLDNSLGVTINRSRPMEIWSESVAMRTSVQNHDGVVQWLDIFSEKETIEKYIVNTVVQSVIENRNLTGKEAIERRIGEINNFLQGIRLATRLVDISPTQPIFESFNGKPLSIDELSSGEKQFYYRAALLSKLGPTHHLLLIDEPETSLHPTWQKEVVKLYRNAGSDNQIILATHSPHIIASVPPESLFVLYLDEDTRQIKVFNGAKARKFTKGVEPNRILQEVMGMKELRDSETLQQIADIANLLRLRPEQVDLPENQEKIEKLREDLGNGDPFIIRMDHQLLLIERRNLSSDEIPQ